MNGEFIGCSVRLCRVSDWSGRAEERGWFRIPESRKFLCPGHRPDSYESMTGHEITCLAGAGMPCDCETMTVEVSVRCDRCGFSATSDYAVTTMMNREQRLQAARDWLTENEKWSHKNNKDLCRVCTRGLGVSTSRDGIVTVTVKDYEFLDDEPRGDEAAEGIDIMEFGLTVGAWSISMRKSVGTCMARTTLSKPGWRRLTADVWIISARILCIAEARRRVIR